MKTVSIEDVTTGLSAFEGMDAGHRNFLAGCASFAHFEAGTRILRSGEPADGLFLIRTGKVALELRAPGRTIVVQTVDEDDFFGWSWMVPPFRWHFDARALTPVSAIRFDAECVRRKCENDAAFGYQMMKCFVPVIVDRLMGTRLQVMEVYR
jgi:CRP/FNR family transcriptional regulator, cyclic AMP receptor protein